MTFDFTNYTYSGLLSFVTVLFSIAYPQIISSIEKVDTRYNSTSLISRFKKEMTFTVFRIVLVINLISAVLIPFLMYGSEYTYIYITVQGVFSVCLIASTFCLFHTILLYEDPIKLHQSIWNKYRNLLYSQNKNKDAEFRSFTEWIDLSKNILSSCDQVSARKIYEGWSEYIGKFYKEHKLDDTDYDQYFYDGLTRLNETLCQMPSVPISINNGNDIMTSLIFLDKRVTQSTYTMLWRNLRIQLFYGKDDWIMEYWAHASQKYALYMQRISVYEWNEDTKSRYTQEEVTRRDNDRWLFLRFHIMLCAMVMKLEKYGLLSRMLGFYQSKTPAPVYPLVPSDISSVCSAFNQINIDCQTNPFIFEGMFPMPGMNGISDGKIQGAAFEYLSLLLFRIYTLTLPWGAERALQTINVPKGLNEIATLNASMTMLLSWTKKTHEKNDLLKCIDIIDWDHTFNEFNNQYDSTFLAPEDIIKQSLIKIEKQEKESKQNLPYDEDKVRDIKKKIACLINKWLIPYKKVFFYRKKIR